MAKKESCKKCELSKDTKESTDASANIEYMDDKFSLSVSSTSVKSSKKIFNELFERVSKPEEKAREYIG